MKEKKTVVVRLKGLASRRRFLYLGAAGALGFFAGYGCFRRSTSVTTHLDTPIDIADWTESASRAAGSVNSLLINGIEYRFRWSPAGSFMMGSPTSEAEHCDDERQHKVTLTRGFWILETETTQETWESVTGVNPSCRKGANKPVEQVSWYDVQEFLRLLNSASGLPSGVRFRLPTEAEWEYSCRAGKDDTYSGSNNLDDVGWCSDNSGDQTHEVGTKKANAWGLRDMSGNVWEWCNDWHDENYYTDKSVVAPKGPSRGLCRVNRGGSWRFHAMDCRCAFRAYEAPDVRSDDLGFRLVLEAGK